MTTYANEYNNAVKKSVTFFQVQTGIVRDVLVKMYADAVILGPNEEFDAGRIRHDLSDEQALLWLQGLLNGHEPVFVSEYHRDGSTTLHPALS